MNVRQLPDAEVKKLDEFLLRRIVELLKLLDGARESAGPERVLQWIDVYEHWCSTLGAFSEYVEKLGQIFRAAGRLDELDHTVMPAPNEHFYAHRVEILEEIRKECLARNLPTSAITRVLSATNMVFDGLLSLTKEQGSGTTAERHQQAMQIVQPFYVEGLPPGAMLNDLLARLKHLAQEEIRRRNETANDAPNSQNDSFRAPDYHRILQMIDRFGKSMECLPSMYRDRNEESLRDQFLTLLAANYDSVTAESFNRKGKTDILVTHGGEHVLIAECKFWNGVKACSDAIDQVLSYLTWHDRNVALIVFVKQKELDPILQKISSVPCEHSCFARKSSSRSESWHIFEMTLPEDRTRSISLAVLCFHFPMP
ncbi:MAG TPA: hypothetical protein VM008_19180 [Phycisphaerae bacterium]|nr:hypothetical protein [Phycisphaerae bacterium]